MQDDRRKRVLHDLDCRRACVGVAQAEFASSRNFYQNQRRAFPSEGAVGLRSVRGDGIGSSFDAVYPRSRFDHDASQTISRTLSDRIVRAILPPFGVPRTSDSARCAACASSTFGGIGGSFGSTTASITT